MRSGVDELDRQVPLLDAGGGEREPAQLLDVAHLQALGGQLRADDLDLEQGSVGAPSVGGPELGREPFGVLAVGLDDALHELVADDVLAAEAHELDALDRLEDLADDDEPGPLVAAAGRSA